MACPPAPRGDLADAVHALSARMDRHFLRVKVILWSLVAAMLWLIWHLRH